MKSNYKMRNYGESKGYYCNDSDENRNELRKHGCGADGGKFAPVQTPTASIVPQLWNPRHMLGFEEFKVCLTSAYRSLVNRQSRISTRASTSTILRSIWTMRWAMTTKWHHRLNRQTWQNNHQRLRAHRHRPTCRWGTSHPLSNMIMVSFWSIV